MKRIKSLFGKRSHGDETPDEDADGRQTTLDAYRRQTTLDADRRQTTLDADRRQTTLDADRRQTTLATEAAATTYTTAAYNTATTTNDTAATTDTNTAMASSQYVFDYTDPYSWEPPAMVIPVEQNYVQTTMTSSADYGCITTDASLYTLKEMKEDSTCIVHSVLKMPSVLPGDNSLSSSTFNILMVDVSGSMHAYWPYVQEFWNQHVAPNLVGVTRIFTFDNKVRFRRTGRELESNDFSRGGTELTGALQTIVSQVYQCQEKYVNIFIVSDGDHNGCRISPESVIEKMSAPQGKVCNVFVLGAGHSFPVQYSIDIRSRLHNGSSNIPSLFWAKQNRDIDQQMQDIGSSISGGVSLSMKLDAVGTSLPGLETRDTFHLNELVYFVHEPEKYKELNVTFNNQTAKIILQPKDVDMKVFLDIVRQWNSVIIQLKFKKEHIPEDILAFMERLFKGLVDAPSPTAQSLSERLREKDTKGDEMEFRTLLNGIKSILTTEKYQNEIQLAESILSTTVTRTKYEVKALQLKGHTDKEYDADVKEFMEVYSKNKNVIRDLQSAPEDRCQATKTSTLSDLQDENFPKLMEKNKFDFLKAFTISGIPVFAPTRDSVTLNPWSFSVQKMLGAPYTIMSTVAMETMAQNSTDKVNKQVQAKPDDDKTNFNAIVPVFHPSAAKCLKPIVRTRIYAMCVTFATLKNPHLIDFNIHMASLGVTWVRCLFENPDTPRPEHVRIRMESIEATALLYLDRPAYANYGAVLKENTSQALMTESTIERDGKPVKCETIIKPMFILNMIQHSDQKLGVSNVANIVEKILIEYVGRCLSHYKTKEGDDTPYTDFFAETLDDQEKKKKWVQTFIEDAKKDMVKFDAGLLSSFYTFEKARKAAKIIAKEELEKQKVKMAAQIPLKVNVGKVEQLRNVTVAGDVSWATLKTYAKEVGLDEDKITELFSEKSVFVYTTHALKNRSSRDRQTNSVSGYDDCRKFVTEKVKEENLRLASKELYAALISSLEDVWLKEYLEIHTEVVEPMSRQQILVQAQQRGIQVTEDTFDEVYKKYRSQVGLLGNACQTKACPYYLQPNKSYNQHASVERMRGTSPFIHTLHQTAYQFRDRDVKATLTKIVSGSNTKDKKPVPQDTVSKLTGAIKKLKNIYSERAKAESMDTN